MATRSSFRITAILLLSLCAAFATFSQTSASSTAHAKTKPAKPAGMTSEVVIKLTKANLSEDLTLEQIKRDGRPIALTTDQLIQLKSAPVSDRVF